MAADPLARSLAPSHDRYSDALLGARLPSPDPSCHVQDSPSASRRSSLGRVPAISFLGDGCRSILGACDRIARVASREVRPR